MKKLLKLIAEWFEYQDNYIDYPGKGIITDAQVREMVRLHTHWYDRLNFRHMVDWGLTAQLILMGVIEEPEGKWYFKNQL